MNQENHNRSAGLNVRDGHVVAQACLHFPRRHDGRGAPAPPPLPVDLLLEILARVDVATVVRCAATSKTVRRAILGDPTIGRRVEANGALLLGVSYAISEYEIYRDIRVSFVGQAPRQNHLGFNAGRKLRCSQPVASRGGLIVLLERRSYPHWLFVWNTVTRSIQWVQLPTANVATAGGYPSYGHMPLSPSPCSPSATQAAPTNCSSLPVAGPGLRCRCERRSTPRTTAGGAPSPRSPTSRGSWSSHGTLPDVARELLSSEEAPPSIGCIITPAGASSV